MQYYGRYQVLKELGRGAMGVVYAASDPTIGRTVAIKTIRYNELSDEEHRAGLKERLRREAQAAGMLAHPGIVAVHDYGEESNEAYIVMELVEGTTLEDILASGIPQRSQVLINVIKKAAEALDYAHSKGVIHRDLKPGNILVSPNGWIKITDFGIARLPKSTAMTQAGFVLGTPDYMSPEQAQGESLDGRSDQFSLAVIASRLLTGKLPFRGPTLTAVLTKILWEEPDCADPNLDPQILKALRKAMSKDRTKRYASCMEFAQDLERAYLSAQIQASTNQSGPKPEPLPDKGDETSINPFGPVTQKPPEERPAQVVSEITGPISTSLVQEARNKDGQEPKTVVDSSEKMQDGQATVIFNDQPSPSQEEPQARPKGMGIGILLAAAIVIVVGVLALFVVYFMRSHRGPVAQSPAPQTATPSQATVAPPPVPEPVVQSNASTATSDLPKESGAAVAAAPITTDSLAQKPAPRPKTEPRSGKSAVKAKPEAASAKPSLSEKPQPQVPVAPPPVAAAVVREPEKPETQAPKAPETGVISWTGKIGKNAVLVITDGQASVGVLNGKLPGIPVTIRIEPNSVLVREAPGAGNSWKQLILNSGPEKQTSITIRWTAVK